MKDYPPALKAFVTLTILSAAGMLAWLWPSVDLTHWPEIVFWSILLVVATVQPLKLPRGGAAGTASALVSFAIVLLLGPAIAAWLAVFHALVFSAIQKRMEPVRFAFNVSQAALSRGLAGLAYLAAGGVAGPIGTSSLVPFGWPDLGAVLAAGFTYFFVNTGSVSVAVALHEGASPWRVWFANCWWQGRQFLALLLPAGLLMAIAYLELGVFGVVLFIMPLSLARYAFKMYVDLLDTYKSTVQALTSAIDASDPFTRGHSYRISQYAELIAQDLHLPQKRSETLYYASMFHDIGKIGIQNDILMKPGRLSEHEMNIMKRHPDIGAEIISNLTFLKDAAEIVRAHHERPDGRGYPRGLLDGQVPVEAKIIMVVDAYDAMTSNRPYRAAMDPDKAIGELRKHSGTQFDHDVVESLARLQKQGKLRIDRGDSW